MKWWYFFFHYKSYNTLICVISIDLHIFLRNYKPKEASYENLEVKVQASHDPIPHKNLYSTPKVVRARCVKYLNFEKFVSRNLTSLATCMVHLHSRNVNFGSVKKKVFLLLLFVCCLVDPEYLPGFFFFPFIFLFLFDFRFGIYLLS